jgi:hypothetical protein
MTRTEEAVRSKDYSPFTFHYLRSSEHFSLYNRNIYFLNSIRADREFHTTVFWIPYFRQMDLEASFWGLKIFGWTTRVFHNGGSLSKNPIKAAPPFRLEQQGRKENNASA